MIEAKLHDREFIIKILTQTFEDNQSVNYIIKQDDKKIKRVRALMNYSFNICLLFGKVYLSDDRLACALILYPHQKRTTVKSILLDVKLIISCIGLGGVRKALDRESKIKKIQHKEKMSYLWFIGVNKLHQGSGIGSKLLKEIIEESDFKKLPVFLETSTLKNLPWYKKLGFTVYQELQLSYTLFFLRHDLNK